MTDGPAGSLGIKSSDENGRAEGLATRILEAARKARAERESILTERGKCVGDAMAKSRERNE